MNNLYDHISVLFRNNFLSESDEPISSDVAILCRLLSISVQSGRRSYWTTSAAAVKLLTRRSWWISECLRI